MERGLGYTRDPRFIRVGGRRTTRILPSGITLIDRAPASDPVSQKGFIAFAFAALRQVGAPRVLRT